MFYIGIDDTDNPHTRGTGFRARQLAALIAEKTSAEIISVSRHQLFFDPRVPYTSQNSSACLVIENGIFNELKAISRSFLLEIAAEGSDIGLCISAKKNISEEIIAYAEKAKIDIVTQNRAKDLAKKHAIYLEGLTGNFDGIIGALSAVGLRFSGNDGRCMLIKGKDLREISGILTKQELLKLAAFDDIINDEGKSIPDKEKILLNNWIRPVVKNNRIILIAEEVKNEKFKWQLKDKEFIKSISN